MSILSQIPGWHDADHQRLVKADERELSLIPRVAMATYVSGFAVASNAFSTIIPRATKGNGWLLISITRSFYFFTAQDAVNRYTAMLSSAGLGVADTSLTVPSSTAIFTTAARNYELTEEYNVALDTNHPNIVLTMTPNGAPGNYFMDVSITYKLL